MRPTKRKSSGKKGITLRDVVVHMERMEQRLSSAITGVEGEVKGLKAEMTGVKGEVRGLKVEMTGVKREVQGIKVGMKDMEQRLSQRMDALDEDLTATIKDTIRIQQHVGMPVVLE